MTRSLLLTLLLFPALALAATQAGFPSQPIWISKTVAVEGETLIISTLVLNSGSETLRATLVFVADEARIGARELELPAGESQIHSLEWKPKAGEHHVAAKIEGTSAALSQSETPSLVVQIAEPPPPSAAEAALSRGVETAGNFASSSIPLVRGVATNIFNVIEPYRQAGVEKLQNYLESSRKNQKQGTIAGTSTSNTAGFDAPSADSAPGMLSELGQLAAAAALFAMSSLWLFYPLLALLVLGTLYLLAKRVRRKPRDY